VGVFGARLCFRGQQRRAARTVTAHLLRNNDKGEKEYCFGEKITKKARAFQKKILTNGKNYIIIGVPQ
jgi:hypothetical protein